MAVWDSEIVPRFAAIPGLTAMTLLEEMQRRHPEKNDDSLLRMLQRRVGTCNASCGEVREVFFAQEHPPGRQRRSDFMNAAVLRYLLYQFTLAYSGWRQVEVVLVGESFMALSWGLQNAIWMMDGVPEEDRTDSLSAA